MYQDIVALGRRLRSYFELRLIGVSHKESKAVTCRLVNAFGPNQVWNSLPGLNLMVLPGGIVAT
jgi:hypothetical protein